MIFSFGFVVSDKPKCPPPEDSRKKISMPRAKSLSTLVNFSIMRFGDFFALFFIPILKFDPFTP